MGIRSFLLSWCPFSRTTGTNRPAHAQAPPKRPVAPIPCAPRAAQTTHSQLELVVERVAVTSAPVSQVAGPQIYTLQHGSYYLGAKTKLATREDNLRQKLAAQIGKGAVIPTVLLNCHEKTKAEDLYKTANSFLSNDDVCTKDFLTNVVILQRRKPASPGWPHVDLVEYVSQQDNERFNWPLSHQIEIEAHGLPQGPYFLTPDNFLAEAWRLYPDTQDAFATTFAPTSAPSSVRPLATIDRGGIWRSVAVPSRLYYTAKPDKPLAGLRVTVKDNFKVAGAKTTQNNRAFVELYPPDQETAPYIEELRRLGAVVVGKTKMCAFASSEEATDQWIDFHAPFNPRADGYQSPSGSTTGGAVSLAAYDWLDFSVGTDTTGSIRWPAAWNGLYGMRLTWGAESLSGVFPSCRAMDTLGLLCRDIDLLRKVISASLPSLKECSVKPTRIWYPRDFFPHANARQQAMVDNFVENLEGILGVKRTVFSIAEKWDQCPPEKAQGKSLREFIDKTAEYPFYYDGYNEFAQFREDYEKEFRKPVYVGPYMRWKWDHGATITVSQKDEELNNLDVYKRWFEDTILSSGSSEGSSDAILILPCGSGAPKYRDTPNGLPGVVPPYSPNYVASMLGLPQIVVPIGQLPFDSRITKTTEQLPIVASIAGAPKSDLLLVDLAKYVLQRSEKPTKVETGKYTFRQTSS
ncbi:putative amidase [Diplogelasinospora grovesii]|uniref:Amidase n=1 Tax=Diplogelasinospora grovesii TaxID=303347 RepID=A0AAN6N0R9_9PEZI|nr:putative amidase [Diplogelasinospora grovesii]